MYLLFQDSIKYQDSWGVREKEKVMILDTSYLILKNLIFAADL